MNGSDVLLDDGSFPHGTPQGWEDGCRGGSCPAAREDGLLSCAQAKIRYNGDFAYKRMVDGGMTPQQIRDADQETAATIRSKPAAPPVAVERPSERFPDAEPPTTDVVAEPRPSPSSVPPSEDVHGTTRGYGRGCRGTGCPNVARGGISCSAAQAEYMRQYAARKKAEKAEAEQSSVKPPKKDVVPDPVPEVVEAAPDAAPEVKESIVAETGVAERGEKTEAAAVPLQGQAVGLRIDPDGHGVEIILGAGGETVRVELQVDGRITGVAMKVGA